MLFLGFGKHVFLGISAHKNDASAAAAERYESKRNSRQISTQKSLINVFFLNSIWIILKYFYIFPKSQSLILLQQRKYSGCTTHIIIIIINQDLAPLDIWLGLSRELHGVWSLLLINISPKQRRDDATIRTFINFFSHRQACQRRVKRRAREENMNINHHSSFTSPYVNNIKKYSISHSLSLLLFWETILSLSSIPLPLEFVHVCILSSLSAPPVLNAIHQKSISWIYGSSYKFSSWRFSCFLIFGGV